MKKLYYLRATVAMMALAVSAQTVSALDVWDGSTENTSWYTGGQTTYNLYTAADLAGLAQLVNEGTDFTGITFVLNDDIDLNGEDWPMIGNAENRPFRGTFDGNGHTISNIYVDNNQGLFGDVKTPRATGLFGWNSGTIQNLTVENGNFEGVSRWHNPFQWYGHYDAAGGICGINNGTIADCQAIEVNPEVSTGDYAGSICGQNNGVVTGCLSAIDEITNSAGDVPNLPLVSDGNQGTDCYYRVRIVANNPDNAIADMQWETDLSEAKTIDGYDGFFVKEGTELKFTVTTASWDHHTWDPNDPGWFVTTNDEEVTVSIIGEALPGDTERLRRLSEVSYTVNASAGNLKTIEYTIERTIPSAVDGVTTRAGRVYGTDGYVVIEGNTGNAIVIVDLAGRTVYNGKATGERTTIALQAGIYIANGVKVVVR